MRGLDILQEIVEIEKLWDKKEDLSTDNQNSNLNGKDNLIVLDYVLVQTGL